MPKYSVTLENLPKYPFAKVGALAKKVEVRDKVKVTNLRIGIPDKEAPSTIKDLLSRYVLEKNSTYGYPCDMHDARGIPELVDAIIQHYKERHGTDIKPENIAVTNWTKPVLHQMPGLFASGKAAITEPVYPVYVTAANLAGHQVSIFPTSKENNWLPYIKGLDKNHTFFYLCDPNNPTDSVANENFYEELYKEMLKKDIGGIFDKAYKDYRLDPNINPVSITQIPELMDVGYEVFSFSKQYNFVGIGLGWIVSSERNIDRWLNFDSHVGQGVAWYTQKIGTEALTNPEVNEEMKTYMNQLRKRSEIMVEALNDFGFECEPCKATPYLFAKIPEKFGDKDEYFALEVLLNKGHVATMPGSYFGDSGKGYVRFTLFAPVPEIIDGMKRIKEIKNW
ncbi:pyridoxal phosphate-dependent aminotransferase [Candidatus Pacearchaeota archaeon]|nr:pyridoxal phosphate-dependent aminotransferase [Candidatus Pacearchaeota archaeon]